MALPWINDKKVKSSFYILVVGIRQTSREILVYDLNQRCKLGNREEGRRQSGECFHHFHKSESLSFGPVSGHTEEKSIKQFLITESLETKVGHQHSSYWPF